MNAAAAIYARVSKEKAGVTEDARSPARQIENARAFAAKRGWTVATEHVFIDDGVSGAEFGDRRPGLQRLLKAAGKRSPFQFLIVSEQKSLGREASETGFLIKQLDLAGVEIIEYMNGRSLTPRNAKDKVMSNIQGYADETHSEATAERVHEAHTKKAKQGYSVGGRVFGYRNEHVYSGSDVHGNQLKSHTARVIEPTEAAVVRRIFELYDSGLGHKAIAKRLTVEGAAAPKPFKRKDGLSPVAGWSPTTIGAILKRDLYAGVIVWNRTKKRNWGAVDQRPRPQSEWLTVPAEHLLIIEEKLWTRVQSRRADTANRAVRFDSGRLSGRPPKQPTGNLLAGLATCGVCGGGLIVATSARKGGRVAEYVCSRRRLNGSCTNSLRMPVEDMTEAVLQAIEEHALTASAIEQVIALSERDDVADRQAQLASEAKDIAKKIGRLVTAIAETGHSAALVAKLRDHEARQQKITAEAASLTPIPRLKPQVINDRLSEWRRLLRQNVTTGRTVLQRVLRGRITFTPRPASDWPLVLDGETCAVGECDGYDFEAETRYDRLFTGIAVQRPKSLDANDRTGCEDIGPEDTHDADYGRLLEKACERDGVPNGIRSLSRVVGSVLRRAA